MIREGRRPPASGWSVVPQLVRGAPPAVLVVVGALALLVGLLIVTRPLTSLLLLTVYVGLSAILSGLARMFAAPESPRWSRVGFGAIWIGLGLAVLLGLGRTLELLPQIIAVLLLLGGLASIYDAIAGGSVSERVLAAVWAGAQIVFGILSFAWPDVTVLVVAVVFGVRTTVFGATLLVRAVRAFVEGRRSVPAVAHGTDDEQRTDAASSAASTRPARSPQGPARRALLAAGRYALSAVLIALAIGGWWANAWIQDGAQTVDAFYDPPAVVPYEHGRLIRVDDFAGQQPPGADLHRILYTTRDAVGQPAVASALVVVPQDPPPGPRPVVSWNHGTTGVARGCAPSLRDASATKWAIPGLDEAVARGWVVVASDYTGQGAPGVFPYLIGPGEARSSLDAVRAAHELEGLKLSSRTVVWGHSQGGHAALWTSQIADQYAPEIDVRGTAVLAPAAEPVELAEELTSGEANALLSILISWVLVPYADTYDDVDLTRYIAPGSQAIVREMTQRCPSEPGVVVSVATALGVSEDRPLYVGDLTAGPLGRRLDDNTPRGPWQQPLLVAWGDEDEVIPPHLQQQFVDRLCAQGQQVRSLEYRGYDHLQTLLPGSHFVPVLLDWTDARLRRADTHVDDCGG
ncbi:lipase family protein [Microbacterium sp. M3]|uniref:Lipase family protein n=1 Tax=Microbacterium arthrosphaerae TaxID=792652 RepID=A0ABU4H1H6_9MICO|nr:MULTISPECIES: lipase family protein [Microbacterium]MDW4573176.1 lipase family protein [Microbacterium arthrosphaerae]MDW7607031.1 lipase family protein [Microbacterium sp. M3]